MLSIMSSRSNIIEILSNFLSQIKLDELNNKKIVIKEYNREHGLLKWFIIKTGSDFSKTYPYTFNPFERMSRETSFFDEVSCGINIPRVYLKDWINLVIVREYVEGDSIKPDDFEYLNKTARLIASIHEYGYVLGDTKFYNFIKTNNRIYVIDAEQALMTSNEKYMYWDIMVYLTIAIYYIMNKYFTKAIYTAQQVVVEFLNSYINERGSRGLSVLKNYSLFNYKSIVYLLLPLPYSTFYLKTISNIFNKG